MKIISFCFLSLIKTRRHQGVEETAFHYIHKSGKSLRLMLITETLSLLQQQFTSPTFAASSI